MEYVTARLTYYCPCSCSEAMRTYPTDNLSTVLEVEKKVWYRTVNVCDGRAVQCYTRETTQPLFDKKFSQRYPRLDSTTLLVVEVTQYKPPGPGGVYFLLSRILAFF
eukprot:scaffold8790_cov187-Amphora_coffeaeformis.AAC.8